MDIGSCWKQQLAFPRKAPVQYHLEVLSTGTQLLERPVSSTHLWFTLSDPVITFDHVPFWSF